MMSQIMSIKGHKVYVRIHKRYVTHIAQSTRGPFQSFRLISESFLAAESLKYLAYWDPITPTATIQSRLNKYHLLTKVLQQKVINF